MGNSYTEDHLILILLDNFYQGGKCTDQILSHHAELGREERITDQKYLSISYLQTDDLNFGNSSGKNN